MNPTTSEPRRGGAALDHPRRCTARRHDGEPCRRYAARGATVCRVHGGAAPQVQAAARRRLQQATDSLAARLLGIALDEGTSETVRLAAIRDALDRGGVTAKAELELSAKPAEPWREVLGNVAGVARVSQTDSRRARGLPVEDQNPMPALEPVGADTVIDAEVVDENPDAPSAYPTSAPSGTHKPPWRRPPYGPGADEPIIPPTGSPASKALVTIEEAAAAERQRQYAEAARRERERASTGRIARRAR